jgi:hypothetical protein
LLALYQDVLGRELDDLGAAAWGLMLAQGASRTDIALLVLESAEGEAQLVQGVYNQYLRRAAEAAGLQYFVAALQSPGWTETQLLTDILASDEYFALAG